LALPATDDFNRADGGLGANWTTGNGTPGIVSNQSKGGGSASNDAYWSADVFDDGQYSQAKVYGGVNKDCGPTARASGTSRYLVATQPSSVILYRSTGESYVQVQNLSSSAVDGDVIRVEAESTTLRVYKNAVQIGTDAADANFASGSAGLWSYASNPILDDWEGGNLAYTPGAVGVDRMNLRQFPKAFMRRKS
jgi:hypothetical protein